MRAFLRRLRARIKYRHFERDLAQEVEMHREMAEADLTASGESRQDARWKTARLLGNTTLAREDSRAMWIPRYVQQLSQDARYALRGMRRDAGFTFATVLMLALGIGLAAGGLGFVNGLFLRGWPVPDSSDVFRVEAVFTPSAGRVDDGISLAAYRHIAANAHSAHYMAYGGVFVRVGTDKDERRMGRVPRGLFVSDNFFQALKIPLLMGTAPLPQAQSSTPTVVISHKTWQTIFGGDPRILGRTVWLDGQPTTAVGVTSPGFMGLDMDTAVYAPLWAAVALHGRGKVSETVADERACCVSVAARAAPGTSRAANASELNTLVAQYRSSIGAPSLSLSLPNTTSGDGALRRGNLAAILALVGTGALALLVLTCANVGNLHLARSLRRQHEIVTRLALGASRARIVRQLLTEGLVLASVAGTLAFGAAASVPVLMGFAGEELPPSVFGVDWRVAAGTAVAVVIVCAMVSLAPALRVTRVVWRGSSAMATSGTGGLRGSLLAVQIAIATVLILSAALISRGIQYGVSAPSDFALTSTTAAILEWPRDATPNSTQLRAFRAALKAAIGMSALPIGLSTQVPVSAGAGLSTSVRVPDASVEFTTTLFPIDSAAATVLKLRLKAGRWASDTEAAREGVINETLARQMWGDDSAIGRTVRLDFNGVVYTIVGVVADTHLLSPAAVPATMHIAPISGAPVLLMTMSPAAESTVRSLIKNVAPSAQVSFMPLTDSIRGTMAQAMSGAVIAGSLGLVALILAMTGVYGVFSYLVEERRREIGIRLALGAERTQIRAAIFAATRTAMVGGLVGGLLLSVLAGLTLRRFLFGMSPADPISYAAVVSVLLVTAIVATLVPIRRALRVDPAVTLRAE